MTPETLAALKASIKHHEENRDCPEKATIGPDKCALCKLFYDFAFPAKDYSWCCQGCPVMEATGRAGCQLSPYDDLSVAYENLLDEPGDEGFLKAFIDTEQREIDFLKSLLPDGEKESAK